MSHARTCTLRPLRGSDAHVRSSNTQIRIRLPRGTEHEFEVIVVVNEGQQVVIHEVKRCKPELQGLMFGDFEVFYQRQITGKGAHVGTSLIANGIWSNGVMAQAALCGASG